MQKRAVVGNMTVDGVIIVSNRITQNPKEQTYVSRV